MNDGAADRPLRIWHQSLTVLDDVPAYRAALQAHADAVVRPDTQVVLHGMTAGTYGTDYPGQDIIYDYVASRHAEQFVDAALQAEREGYDAFVIATLPDLGFEHIRTLVDIPVVPIGLTSVASAVAIGDSVGVVGFIAELEPWVRRNVSRVGLDRILGPFTSLGATFHDVLGELERPGPVMEAFERAAALLVDEGANVILPGEGPLNVLLARHGVARVHGTPVLDSVGVAFSAAEARALEFRRTGLHPSRRGFYLARPPVGLVDQVRSFYGRGPTASP